MENRKNNCGLLRRLGAIFYDCLLLSAVLFFCTLILLPLTHGQAIASGNIPFDIYLYLITYLYFVWQWSHGGQTLGMRAWKIRLESVNTVAVPWRLASLRFLLACMSWIFFGIGFLWSLIDKDQLTLHDRYSRTRLKLINVGD